MLLIVNWVIHPAIVLYQKGRGTLVFNFSGFYFLFLFLCPQSGCFILNLRTSITSSKFRRNFMILYFGLKWSIQSWTVMFSCQFELIASSRGWWSLRSSASMSWTHCSALKGSICFPRKMWYCMYVSRNIEKLGFSSFISRSYSSISLSMLPIEDI